MWHADSSPSFVAAGAERDLLVHAAANLAFQLYELSFDDEDETAFVSGIKVVDSLPRQEQMILLAQVVRDLICFDTPPPELTALNEGMVAHLYRSIAAEVEMEIEDGRTSWRELVMAAATFVGMEPEEFDRDSTEDWELLIDCLSDRILWDGDYEDGDLVLDASPVVAEKIKEEMGIDPDYYVCVPPLVTPFRFAQAFEFLNDLSDRFGMATNVLRGPRR